MAVYKDECVYTFDNQYSPHGVDVCLRCYIGTSSEPAHDFTTAHSRLTGHTAFLNIRRIHEPKQVDEAATGEEPQPKRLHIRDSGEDDYKEIVTFKTLGSDNESDFAEQREKVLTSDSYAKAKQVEEWQLELEPCEHIAILESVFDGATPQRMSTEQLSKCSHCDLTSNLWLCLRCGNLGCGRRQFDGSGGNGHALIHFDECGEEHAVAVKLGSITPEGHVDVYCYACNDDKLDPNIAQHLAHWGIDIAKQTKTEKSMTELQLEQNMNWDFTSGDGGEPVHGPGFTGMKNLGNSCYMNSVLQSLFDIPEFAQYFSPNDPGSEDLGDANDLTTQLNKVFDGLKSGRYDVISPQMLKYLIGKDHAEFATAKQQDAFEYLTHFLTLVSTKYKDLASKIFGFMSERRISCENCDAVRYVDEPQENLSISVPIEETGDGQFRAVTFAELLDLFTAEEIIESKCARCKATRAHSCIKFKTFPVVLIMNVRRFRIVNWVPQKVDVPLIVPVEVNLDKYLSTGPQEGENILTDEEIANAETAEAESNKYSPDEDSIVMLVSMGFDQDLVVAGLRLAHDRGLNAADLEAVINLIVSGEAAEYASNSTASSSTVDPEKLMMLESMGFTQDQAHLALKHNSGNVEAAVEWLFAGKYEEALQTSANESNQSEEGNNVKAVLGDATLPANYALESTICHKGSSVHVGHYVSAICKPDGNYLFNDERVTKNNNDMTELQKFAYIYMFHRI